MIPTKYPSFHLVLEFAHLKNFLCQLCVHTPFEKSGSRSKVSVWGMQSQQKYFFTAKCMGNCLTNFSIILKSDLQKRLSFKRYIKIQK